MATVGEDCGVYSYVLVKVWYDHNGDQDDDHVNDHDDDNDEDENDDHDDQSISEVITIVRVCSYVLMKVWCTYDKMLEYKYII